MQTAQPLLDQGGVPLQRVLSAIPNASGSHSQHQTHATLLNTSSAYQSQEPRSDGGQDQNLQRKTPETTATDHVDASNGNQPAVQLKISKEEAEAIMEEHNKAVTEGDLPEPYKYEIPKGFWEAWKNYFLNPSRQTLEAFDQLSILGIKIHKAKYREGEFFEKVETFQKAYEPYCKNPTYDQYENLRIDSRLKLFTQAAIETGHEEALPEWQKNIEAIWKEEIEKRMRQFPERMTSFRKQPTMAAATILLKELKGEIPLGSLYNQTLMELPDRENWILELEQARREIEAIIEAAPVKYGEGEDNALSLAKFIKASTTTNFKVATKRNRVTKVDRALEKYGVERGKKGVENDRQNLLKVQKAIGIYKKEVETSKKKSGRIGAVDALSLQVAAQLKYLDVVAAKPLGTSEDELKVVKEEVGAYKIEKGPGLFATALKSAMGLGTTFGTSSAEVSAKFTLGASADLLLKALEGGISVYISLGASMNVQDDRRLRVNGSVTLGGSAKLSALWDFLKAEAGISRTWQITGVFDDVTHFSAYLFQKLITTDKSIGKYARKIIGAKLTDDETGTQGDRIRELATKPITKVFTTSTALTGGVSAVWDGLGISASKTSTTQNFYRVNPTSGEKEEMTSTTQVESGEFFVSIPQCDVAIAVTRTVVDNHANPDNDGDYLSVEMSFGKFIPLNMKQLKKFGESLTSMKAFYNRKYIMRTLSEMISDALKGKSPEEEVDPLMTASAGILLQYADVDGDYVRQYIRVTGNETIKKGVGSMTLATASSGIVGASLKGGIEIEASRTATLFETLGTGTLSYLQTVYNGLIRRVNGGEDWNFYRSLHKKGIFELVLKVGTDGTTPRKEAISNGIESVSGVLPSCEEAKERVDSSQSVNPVDYIEDFEPYLAHVSKTTKDTGEERWKKSE